MLILFARAIITSTARAGSVFLPSYRNKILNQPARVFSLDYFLNICNNLSWTPLPCSTSDVCTHCATPNCLRLDCLVFNDRKIAETACEPGHATPRHAAPHHATLRHTMPRYVKSRYATQRQVTSHHSAPLHATPQQNSTNTKRTA